MEKKFKISLLLFIIISFLLSLFLAFGLLADLEILTFDYRLILNSLLSEKPDSKLVIVEIDNESLEEIGSWPWPREKHATLIEILNNHQARLIAFDIMFENKQKQENDQKFSQTLAQNNNILLASSLNVSMLRGITGTQLKTEKLNYPAENFSKSAATGYINLFPDRDGKIRRLYTPRGAKELSFAEKVMQMTEQHIPAKNNFLLNNQQKYINFQHKSNIPHISYKDVLQGNFSKNFFNNKVILVGARTEKINDYWPTSLSPIKGYTAGINIHAQIINNFYHNSFIYKFRFPVILIFMLLFSLLTFYVFYHQNPLPGLGIFTALSLFLVLIAFGLLYYFNIFFYLTPFIYLALFNYTSANIFNFLRAEQKRKQLETMFSRYLSPEVARKLIATTNPASFQGQQKTVTVLFIDLVNFTSYTEKNTPQTTVKTLNQYFELISEEVFAIQGNLNKFLGDGALIVFGTPLTQPDHAQRALKLALRLQKKIKENPAYPLDISIGINTGKVIAGNIGSQQRIEYTVIGDPVNIAARLEENAEPKEIIVGENTYQKTKENFVFSSPQQLKLSGRNEKIMTYKLLDLKN